MAKKQIKVTFSNLAGMLLKVMKDTIIMSKIAMLVIRNLKVEVLQ